MDRVDAATRSRIMASVKSKGTLIEREAARLLSAAGVAFEGQASWLPGRPDFAVPDGKVAVFVHGCFWHRCPHCRPKVPESNAGFWRAKFRANAERDRRALRELSGMGWTAFVVWGCRIGEGMAEVLDFLGKGTDE